MKPTRPDVFARAASAAGFTLDSGQCAAVEVLLTLRSGGGAYLWGPAGRGKTWLVEVLRGELTGVRSTRVHFHDFLCRVHTLAHTEGGVVPALDVMLADCDVLFFDEFHVHDVADGVVLGRLLDALDARGITLVVTSNYPPDGLMPNPIHHEGFEPTIDRLRRRLAVVEVDGGRDHRGDSERRADGFASGSYLPDAELPSQRERVTVAPCRRPITALADRADVLWFDFADLCETPTAAADYLALLSNGRRWVISGVPPVDDATPFAVYRFCTLVDILHDRDVPLTVVGADWRRAQVASVPDLFRAASRLRLLG